MIGPLWSSLALGLALCLVASALGFRRVVYFVSLGYAGSIAAQAVMMPMLFRHSLRDWVLVQSALLFAYGLRLGSFIALREQAASFQAEQAQNTARGAKLRGVMKLAIWLSVSILYVLMFLPALLTMSAQAAGLALPSVPVGVALMLVGLGCEASADWQKSRFKRHNSGRFCDVGLYRIVRFPNYFGEVLFWFGLWVSGISAYQSVLAWVLGGLGFLSIAWIMLGASRRLEQKQADHYGADLDYQAYAARTPILFPLLPLYSLGARKLQGG
jgi:steroid 5-alpha reductase family enzyme